MVKENETEGADLSQQNGSDQSADTTQGDQNNGQQDAGQQSGNQQQGQAQEDYRAKLNATNRFLEKEGYEFKDGGWQRKADSSGQQQASSQSQQTAASALSREETRLIAEGFSDEAIEQLKKVAALNGTDLLKAKTDPIFVAWQDAEKKRVKDRDAQLPPSKGGKAVVKKSFNTKGLSDEDHKELFNEKIGR